MRWAARSSASAAACASGASAPAASLRRADNGRSANPIVATTSAAAPRLKGVKAGVAPRPGRRTNRVRDEASDDPPTANPTKATARATVPTFLMLQ